MLIVAIDQRLMEGFQIKVVLFLQAEAIKILEETTGRWNQQWKAACDKFQDLEEERLDFLKSSLWQFANIASTTCVSDDTVSCSD